MTYAELVQKRTGLSLFDIDVVEPPTITSSLHAICVAPPFQDIHGDIWKGEVVAEFIWKGKNDGYIRYMIP